MKIDTAINVPPPEWNEMLRAAGPEAGMLQSSHRARVLRRTDGTVPIFLRVSEGERVLGQALVMKRYPFDRHSARKLSPLPFLECVDGPVILEPEMAPQVISSMLKSIVKTAKRSLATSIVVTPAHTSRLRDDGPTAALFGEFGFSAARWATYLVDLGPDEEELFSGLRHAARKNVKKCRRNGLVLSKMGSLEEYERVYWDFYVRSETHYGRRPNPLNTNVWAEDTKGYYHYYVARHEEHGVLACLGMYVFNGVATEVASSTSPAAREKKLPAQDLIHWEMMLEAKRMGCTLFDLAGVNPAPEDPKEAGIRRFKEKWGGRYTEYNTYKREAMPGLFRLVSSVRKRLRGRFGGGASR